jgi:hypothetical protein
MPPKRLKLLVNKDFDFFLLGIASSENDYKLCWSINNKLGWNLIKVENLSFSIDAVHESDQFSTYYFSPDNSQEDYHLIANRGMRGHFIEELKNIDYLLKIKGNWDEKTLKDFICQLRTIKDIQGVFVLQPKSYKAVERLIS